MGTRGVATVSILLFNSHFFCFLFWNFCCFTPWCPHATLWSPPIFSDSMTPDTCFLVSLSFPKHLKSTHLLTYSVWLDIHWSRAWSCTDHVADHALITWLIMHWSRVWSCTDHVARMHCSRGWSCNDHAATMYWSHDWSCTDHVTDHALITWLSCTTNVADHAMIM